MKFLIPFLAILCLAASRPAKHDERIREKAISDTLTMTLVVGVEFRDKGKHPTWAEIQQEVYRRLTK